MPEGPDGKTIIIVKKVSGHGGHHGGSWKVAYADFVTSMMCLFLVLWLVNSASVSTREKIASYFRKPGIFLSGSGSPLMVGGAGIMPDPTFPPGDARSKIEDASKGGKKQYLGGGGITGAPTKESGGGAEESEFIRLAKELEKVFHKEGDEGNAEMPNVLASVDQYGLRLEILDTPTGTMFASGSAKLLEGTDTILIKIANVLQELPNPLDIEGHTDAQPFRWVGPNSTYDNWDLSTDRANAARRVLVQNGISEERVAKIVGFADKKLKNTEDPRDAANRRITIRVRYAHDLEGELKGLSSLAEAAKERETGPVFNTNSPSLSIFKTLDQ